MAKAKQCDRCGNLYLPYDGKKYELIGKSYNGIYIGNDNIQCLYYKWFDLCPECMRKIIKFLKMEE